MGEIRQIYKETTEVYPVTKVEAVSNESGESLQSLLDSKMSTAVLDSYAKKTDLEEYAKETELESYAKNADLAIVAKTGSFTDLTYTPGSIGGYGITDAYTKDDIATLLAPKIDDAPSDGNQYARKNGEWEIVEGGSGGSCIDDDTTSTSKTWSSSKISTKISGVVRLAGSVGTYDELPNTSSVSRTIKPAAGPTLLFKFSPVIEDGYLSILYMEVLPYESGDEKAWYRSDSYTENTIKINDVELTYGTDYTHSYNGSLGASWAEGRATICTFTFINKPQWVSGVTFSSHHGQFSTTTDTNIWWNSYSSDRSVNIYIDPSAQIEVGTEYNVETDGMNYVWNGVEWDAEGTTKASSVTVSGSTALSGMTVQQALEYLLALHNS